MVSLHCARASAVGHLSVSRDDKDTAQLLAIPPGTIGAIARVERPMYRTTGATDGRGEVLGSPWLSIDAKDRRSALDATRAAVAAWLHVATDAFEAVSG